MLRWLSCACAALALLCAACDSQSQAAPISSSPHSAATSAATGAAASVATSAVAAPASTSTAPLFDHVVVVVEENHAYGDVIGNSAAPYINDLAARGVDFGSSYAVTHPSEPNYLALFSGSTLGVDNDRCSYSFTAANLADQLLAAGRTFTGYSEDLPRTGFSGCSSGSYARKHAPWVFFPTLPANTNQPFSAFPSDYAALPDVSFVIPNLDNDMHDGSVAAGDRWLRNNLDGYARWAVSHNSLLVLTWDEDDRSAGNQIPTIMVGAGLTPGTDNERIDHYRVLRTIEVIEGLDGIGQAADATPIARILR